MLVQWSVVCAPSVCLGNASPETDGKEKLPVRCLHSALLWQMAGGRWQVAGFRWHVTGGSWQVAGGGGRWQVAGGRWQVAGGW